MNTVAKVAVGVDVSKNYLDVHVHETGKSIRIQNSTTGVERLQVFLSSFKVSQVACEATGGYERLMYNTLAQADYKVWRVDPRRIKAFIFSEGIKAKTDKIDAKMIALFAAKKCSSYEPYLHTDSNEKLKNLVTTKVSLTRKAAEMKTQIQQAYDPDCIKVLTKSLRFLKKQIAELESKINIVIKTSSELQEKAELIGSIPGIGDGTTAITLALLPELGKINNKQIASLVGVAPHIKQSGISKGKAQIGGGRAPIRCVLYMAALSASRHNQVIKTFYQQLINAGKPFKVAIIAVMRKLVIYMNTLIRKKQAWNPAI